MKMIDISSNNHIGQLINWHDVKAAGIDGVYVKATQGAYYTNPYLLMDTRDAHNAGLEVGIYHFYDPANNPTQQAAFFIANGINQVDAGICSLMPVNDIELGDPTRLSGARDEFNAAIGHCAEYMNRWFWSYMGLGNSVWAWLAIPGWSVGQPIAAGVNIVQTGTAVVPGFPGVQCDIDVSIGGIEIVTIPAGPKLNAPVVGIAERPQNDGYWLVCADGAVFGFGGAAYHGGMNNGTLDRPIVDIESAEDGGGYGLVGADGGVFAFGSFRSVGSIPGLGIAAF